MHICNMFIPLTSYYVYMQKKTDKTIYLRKVLGTTIKKLREKQNISGNKLANEYDINNSNLNRIENAVIDSKFMTIWRISEALGIRFSEFAKILEDELGKDFKLMDE